MCIFVRWINIVNSRFLFIDTFVGVDCRGAECSRSMYSAVWALPIPCAFGALYYLWLCELHVSSLRPRAVAWGPVTGKIG